jgi:hypothetical protein
VILADPAAKLFDGSVLGEGNVFVSIGSVRDSSKSADVSRLIASATPKAKSKSAKAKTNLTPIFLHELEEQTTRWPWANICAKADALAQAGDDDDDGAAQSRPAASGASKRRARGPAVPRDFEEPADVDVEGAGKLEKAVGSQEPVHVALGHENEGDASDSDR